LVTDHARQATPHGHVVQFYASDAELFERVGNHLAEAVRSGAVAIVLASPRHAHGFAAWMAASGVDVDAAVAAGTYRVLDAGETLERFLVNGHPDARRFDDVVGEVVRSAAATGRPVYAYGEMVALLWDDGRVNAAIELETFWNDLGLSVPFSLFCAYPSSSVKGEDQAELLSQVCCLHTAIIGADAQHRSTRQFGASSSAPYAARRFVVEALAGLGCEQLIGDAALIVTELATNAVVHARSDFTVAIASSGGAVRIEVRDGSRHTPTTREPSSRTTGGRGLSIIDALASAWGVLRAGDGKVVWVQLLPIAPLHANA
jgi:anti-sigma regulatory factor (Ser/Thr protein kinase)